MSRLTELEHENSMLWKTLKEEREKIENLKAELLIYKKIFEKLPKDINFNDYIPCKEINNE